MSSKLLSLQQLLKSLSIFEVSMLKQQLVQSESCLVDLFQTLQAHLNSSAEELQQVFAHRDCAPLNLCSDALLAIVLKVLSTVKISTQDVVREKIANIRCLYEKKQFDLCITFIEEAQQIALENDLLQELSELFEWTEVLMQYNLYITTSSTTFAKQRLLVYEKLVNYWQYKLLSLSTTARSESANMRIDYTKRLKVLLQDPLLKSEDNALSVRAKILYNTIICNISQSLENYEDLHKSYKRLLDLYSENDNYIVQNWQSYISVIDNFAQISIYLKQYDDALIISDLLKQMDRLYDFVNDNHLTYDLLARAYYIDLQIYKKTANDAQILATITEAEQCLQQADSPIRNDYKISLFYEIAESLFWFDMPQDALIYLHKLSDITNNTNTSYVIYGKLLELLVLHRLGEMEELKTRLPQSKQSLRENRILSRYETLFIDFISKLAACKTKQDQYVTYKEYALLFRSIMDSFKFDNYFNITAWLEKQINSVDENEAVA